MGHFHKFISSLSLFVFNVCADPAVPVLAACTPRVQSDCIRGALEVTVNRYVVAAHLPWHLVQAYFKDHISTF